MTTSPPPWTDAENAFLREKWGQPGWNARRIGDEVGHTKNATIARARRLGLPSPDGTPERVPWTEERMAELRRLAARGLGYRTIARMMGVDNKAVRRRCMTHGIVVRILHGYAAIRNARQAGGGRGPVSWFPSEEKRAERRAQEAARKKDAPLTLAGIPLPPHQEPQGCRWIDGDGPTWRYCQRVTYRHTPYCHAHCARAYVPKEAA